MTDIAAPAKPRSPARYLLMATLRAFNANKTSWIGLVVFALVVMLALLAPFLSPHDPLEQNLISRLKGPGET